MSPSEISETQALDETQMLSLETGSLPKVQTSLYYLARLPLYEEEKPYFVNWPVAGVLGAEQTNLSHKRQENINVYDIRQREAEFSIDKQGFQLVNHVTKVSNDDFENDVAVRERYYPEVIELVKRELGANAAFVFEHTHRLHVPNVKGCGCNRKRKPLVSAHIDQTPESSAQRVRYHMGEEAPLLLKHRYQVVNVWRPLFGPLRDFPLTLGDIRTFNIKRDGVPTDLVFPHYIGESLNLYPHPDHKWYFVSNQMRDEVWMFKCFDSKPDVARGAPHCSFDIQQGTYTERPRESIEVRVLVFYDY